jgi:iron complex outermembrane recepter protein
MCSEARHTTMKKLLPTVIAAQALIASAQAQEAPRPTQLDQVVVSGEKMRRTLDKTLTSVAVATARDLAEHGDQTLTDVMARTPGVSTAPDNQTFSIRGAPVAGLGEQGPNDLISVYVDGAVQPRQTVTLGTLSVWDMEQVEILRGPQSTVQGRNAMAGALVLQSKNPTHQPTLAMQARLGNRGERGAAFVVGGGVVEEQLAVRLAVEQLDNDGYIRNETLNKDANPRRSLTARGKLLWQPTEALDALVTLTHTDHKRGNPVITQVDDQPLFYRLRTNADAWDRMGQDTLSAQLEYRIDSRWTVFSTTAATRTQYDSVLDFDQTDTAPVDEVLRDHRHRLASQELRLAYQGAALKGHVGAYAGRSHEVRDDRLFFDGEPVINLAGDTQVRNRALFGEMGWDFMPQWQLIAGLRYDRERNRTASHFGDAADTVTEGRFHALLPKLGLSWQMTPEHLAGVTVQRGYRGGGAAFNIAEQKAVPFDPEHSTHHEFSYRGSWLDRRVQLSLNAYLTNWRNQQVAYLTQAGNDNSAQVANAGRSRLRGAELRLSYDVSREWRGYLGAALNDTRYLSFVTPTQNLSGQRFERAPRSQLNAGLRWRGAQGLSANLEATYQAASNSEYVSQANAGAPDFGQVIAVRRGDAATLVNASVQYRFGRWLAGAHVRNLLDRDYVVSRPSGTVITAGAPRSVGMSLRFDL